MIRADVVLGVARAEANLARRLVRYWVFQVLAFSVGIIGFVYYAVIHRTLSTSSATVALLYPRYLVGFIGIYYLVLFLMGLIFLGYDVRARDTRERMVEVLDAQPVSNLELLLGRFLGLMIPAWLPVIAVALVLELLGLAMGSAIEPWSLISFAFAMALPAYAFVLGLTFLLTLLLRHRLLAALVLLGLVGGLIVANFAFVKIYMLPLVDITGGFSVPPPSDMLPSVIDLRGLTQRLGFLMAGLGMLWLAAAIHPRRDDARRGVRAAVGAALVLGGIGLCGWLVLEIRGLLQQKEAWKAAHAAKRDAPAPDLEALSGEVSIDPGRSLDMKLDLRLRAQPGQPLDSALFSLNPSLEVRSVTSAGGEKLAFEAKDGLLDVRLPARLDAGAETAIHMEIGGRPDPFFAYLDSVFDAFSASIREGNVFLLGFEPAVFERRFVALLPGIRWLPGSGAEIGRGDPSARPTDFFTLDLTVELPEDWLVAGPGRRQPVQGPAREGRVRFRFAPPAPVPDVPLVAGRFASRSTEIEGVQLELLLHPAHDRNLDVLAPAAGPVRDWLAERFREAASAGLPYPYDALTLVEVPGKLRGYGGGWRMDSTLQQPGLMLVREAGLPTARFDLAFKDAKKFEDREGGLPHAMREKLERFFETDFSGGNPFLGASRSFFGYQTAGSGPAGVPLDFVWEDLANRLVSGKQGYFSIHHYGADLNATIGRIVTAIFQNEGENLAEVMIRAVTSRPEVWDTVLGVSLSGIDPWKEPKRTVDVLTLKGGAMARSVLDGLGREKAGRLLATLRNEHTGAFYTRQDVVAAGQSIGEDLGSWLDTWIDQTGLPGFTLGEVQLDRIAEGSGGTPRYQLRVIIRNEEPVPGLLRVDYRAGTRDQGDERGSSEPVRVAGRSAVEVGLVTSKPPSSVRVVPYLALNRDPFAVPLPSVDAEKVVTAEAWSGAREVSWTPTDEGSIVVDDLDPGFTVEESQRGSARFAGAQSNVETDGGLPVATFGRVPYRWSRGTNPGAWGKYRHTMTLVRSGRGERQAVFQAELPRSGRWEVEYHVPPRPPNASGKRGTWSLKVSDSSGSHDVPFDADGAQVGWNTLGSFEMARGEVRVALSDKTDGRVVIADAVRFEPAGGAALASR